MVDLKFTTGFLANQAPAVDVLGHNTVSGLGKQLAQSAVGIIGIGRILTLAQISDPHILGIISIDPISKYRGRFLVLLCNRKDHAHRTIVRTSSSI